MGAVASIAEQHGITIDPLDLTEMATLFGFGLASNEMESAEVHLGILQSSQFGVDIVVHVDGNKDTDAGAAVCQFVNLGVYAIARPDTNAIEQGGIDPGIFGGGCDQVLFLRQKGERSPPERFIPVEDFSYAVFQT